MSDEEIADLKSREAICNQRMLARLPKLLANGDDSNIQRYFVINGSLCYLPQISDERQRASVFDIHFPALAPAFRECHHCWIFSLSVSNHENHSAPMQSAADLEVPGEF